MKQISIFLLVVILFSTNIEAQDMNLGKMPEIKRNEYLLMKSKEAIMYFGPEWYKEPMSVEISKVSVFFDEINNHPKIQKCNGRRYYTVTYRYNKYLNPKGLFYACKVTIWEDDGEPEGILFGNEMGMTFIFRLYKDWVKDGVKKEEQMPFDEKYYNNVDRILSGNTCNYVDD